MSADDNLDVLNKLRDFLHPQSPTSLSLPDITPFPEVDAPENLEGEIRKLEITRRGFFKLATTYRICDWITGSIATLSTSAVVVMSGFAFAQVRFPSFFPTLPSRLVSSLTMVCFAVSVPMSALSWYCNFEKEYREQFRAGVHYNILYRRLQAVKSISDATKRNNAYQQYCFLRDNFEQQISTYTLDYVHASSRAEVEADEKKKKGPNL
jgi:hypothetical protein